MSTLETRGHADGQGRARGHENITILSALSPRVIAKRWKSDGSIAGYDLAKNFTHRAEPVNNICEFSTLLLKLERDPQSCIVRGGYIGDELAIPKMQGDEGWRPGCVLRSKEVFLDRASHVLMLDIDNYRPSIDPVADPVSAICEFIEDKLPECFAGISFHWQLSSSTGHPSNVGVLKAHVWFWLATPYTSAQLRTWATAEGLAVDRALFDPIQAHYTAAPLFEGGVTDPVLVRSGFSQGVKGDDVALAIVTADVSALYNVSEEHTLDPITSLLYTQTLKMLSPGDRVWVNIPKKGYVGVGIVEQAVQPASEFTVMTDHGEQSVMDVVLHGAKYKALADTPELSEQFVKVKWLDTLEANKAFNEVGLFGNQNTVCQPTTPKWRHTVERLKQVFSTPSA